IKRGILFLGLQSFCYSHSDEDINKTMDAFEEALSTLKNALIEGNIRKYLEGKPVQPVFRKP
ncbi:MAG: aspartate aminotransferase family protein, partial [Candidatus Helarchaeota archaeon]|nr:aspartate aminotransferase family protein [Candidatus Helarchaeota archaeon]